ncbi:hypothetical protein GVN16_05660 [Emticicia sp. CRIBPO]|uniref:DUF6932 family protein n=1 Tax=Emticicia sp. CRIBPO TaxID=2683258 RepID=UPI0014133AE7|nr:hypothetical protein [Emticicia sp. CRIBPO]NBA85236.1 hypothetical protein [Emticicia sp. CRIBPO]
MYKKEYPPLLSEGFKEIKIWQLDSVFLEPFGENQHRKYLIDRFKAFISEFEVLNLSAEIWIDGSFCTRKPEPKDIDVVFLIDRNEIDSLDERGKIIFESLLMQRDEVIVRYGIDVYFIDRNNETEKEKWIETYGFDASHLNTKGIYQINILKNV